MNHGSSSNNSSQRFVETTSGSVDDADEEISGTMAAQEEPDNAPYGMRNDATLRRNDDDDNGLQGHEVEQVMNTSSVSTRSETEKLRFLEYCNLLESNHPAICKVNTLDVPKGYLRWIGDAILRNTRLTELVLYMFDEDLQSASSLIEFVGTSTTLRKVCVHHQCHESHTEIMQRTDQLASLIFEAIAVNKSIQELHVAGSFWIEALHTLLSTSKSITALHVDCDRLDHDYMSRNELFLRALMSNYSIVNLSLSISEQGWMWLEEIPSRMGNGPSTLQSLTLVENETFPPQFYDLLSTTTSLQKLTMECSSWDTFTAEDKTRLLRALADNTSIFHLELNESIDSDGVMMDRILCHLCNGPSTLRKLTLISYNNDFNVLQQYLCSATNLRYLELETCDIDLDSMDCLVEGFRVLDSSPSTSAQLTLNACCLTEAASHRLIDFITARSHRQQWDNIPAEDVVTLLPDLDCVDVAPPAPILRDYWYAMDNFMEVSMSTAVSLPPPDGAPCTPCGPTVLSMRPNGDVTAFSDAWLTSQGMSSLVCLHLWKVGPCDSTNLALWLPRSVSLRALHLVDIQDDVVPKIILNGLRQNGSLLSTTFTKGNNRPYFQDAKDRTVIQSYCQRNRFLSEIMLNKMVFWNVPFVDLEMVSSNDTNPNTVDDDPNGDRLVLVPAFFCAANAIPLTKSRFIIGALLALDATIGPQG